MPEILTAPKLKNLLHVYATIGGDAARALAVEYGIKPSYVKILTSRYRVPVKRRPNKRRLKLPKRVPPFADPRWARARAIGQVIV